MPTVSHSWNASWPIACVGTWPVMIDQRNRVHVGGRDPGHRVGHPRSGGHERDANLLRRARIAVRCVDRPLLVTHEDVLYLVLLEELVVEEEDRAARIAEDVFHALLLKTAHKDLSPGH